MPTEILVASESVRMLARAIRAKPNHDWHIAEMVRRTGLTKPLLSFAMQRTTGMAPMRYVQTCRLEHAARLLSSDDESLPEIASQCGYDSETSLSRAFKRYYGLAPAAYRKSVKVLGVVGTAR